MPVNFDGLHVKVALLVTCVTVRLDAAIDGALLRSPEYTTWSVSEAEAA